MTREFPVFYFDDNAWFGIVDSLARWFDLLSTYATDTTADEALDQVLSAVMAFPMDEYFIEAGGVHTGDIPSFGFRREHAAGTVKLEDWAKNRGTDLRALATGKARA